MEEGYQKLEEDEEEEEDPLAKITSIVRNSPLAMVQLILLGLTLAFAGVFILTILCILLADRPTPHDSSEFIWRTVRKEGIVLLVLLLFFAVYPSGREIVRTAPRIPATLIPSELRSSPLLFIHASVVGVTAGVALLTMFVFVAMSPFLGAASLTPEFLVPSLKEGAAACILAAPMVLYASGRRLLHVVGTTVASHFRPIYIVIVLLLALFYHLLIYV
jgi:hypothetical protein